MTYLRSSSQAMADRIKNKGKGNTKTGISGERKSFLDEIKSVFHNF